VKAADLLILELPGCLGGEGPEARTEESAGAPRPLYVCQIVAQAAGKSNADQEGYL
jgi:hypothetical protein